MRAISAPPSRPEQLMRMPWAPNRIADWTARFIARRKATRRSNCCLGALAHYKAEMREMLFDARRAAAAARVETLHDKSPADRRFLDIEPVDIELVVVLGVGDRRLEYLPYILRDAAAREGQLGQSVRRVLAADRLRDKVQLL